MGTQGRTLAEAGELAFIRTIRAMMPAGGGDIVRSVGDDCLVMGGATGMLDLSTIDTFVDGVHFDPALSTWDDIGRRCMAASVSDIAAMAGLPAYSLVSLSMPSSMLLDDAVTLFGGLTERASAHGCQVLGGETTSTPGPLTVTVTVFGRVERDRLVTRAGARPGDSIFVTGTVGDAMAGLAALQKSVPGHDTLVRRFRAPEARVEAARSLTAGHAISAMIDISDGIATDLVHICDESGVGADIEEALLPLSDDYRTFMDTTDGDPAVLALTGGEDYELLFTSGDTTMPDTFAVSDIPVTRIGTVTDRRGAVTLIGPDGVHKRLTSGAYEHFRS